MCYGDDMKFEKIYFDTLESTNKTASDYPVGSVIIAHKQTGGKGRYGKVWESPVGNLYMSIVLPDYGNKTPDLAFVVAVAMADAFCDFGVRLKWPNDILLDGKKLAGILLERMDDKIIVGIGVNIISAPATNMAYQVTHLQGKMTPEAALDLILNSLSKTLSLFETQGFGAIQGIWKQKAVGIGTHITVNLPNERIQGIFKDLSESGALMLELPDKTIMEITAGVVFLI